MKHTDHAINEDRRGDTARFSDAGAEPVVFAGAGDAVVFSRRSPYRITYSTPRELLDQFTTEIVLIEGFKNVDAWPRIELDHRVSLPEAIAILDRIWR